MNGRVDEDRRALWDVSVETAKGAELLTLTVWIDTAFNGALVFPVELIKQLGLQQQAATEAILADGRRVVLESYVCYLKWFGNVIAAQVIANDGKLPLLGTELLDNRRLTVDYHARTVTLE